MAIGGNFSKPGMGSGAQAPLPSGGVQGGTQRGGNTRLQQNAQRMVPNPGQFNGNPRGVYNTGFRGQGNAPSWQQQTNLGRYVPPTMTGGNGNWNTNQWNNSGGYNYNLPGSYGSPQGGGQFAPMPGLTWRLDRELEPNPGWWSDAPGFGSYDPGGSLYPGRSGQGTGQGATPSYDKWRGGFATDMRARSPEEEAEQEADFRRMYEEQFGSQGAMPPGKDGRPLQVGFAPQPSRDNIRAALERLMGGFNPGGPAPMPQFNPRQFRRFESGAGDTMPGTNMSQMDILRRTDPSEYERQVRENQAGYEAQQWNEFRRGMGG